MKNRCVTKLLHRCKPIVTLLFAQTTIKCRQINKSPKSKRWHYVRRNVKQNTVLSVWVEPVPWWIFYIALMVATTIIFARTYIAAKKEN